MAISIQGFNVGTDASFVITDNFGDIIMDSDMGYLDDFSTESTDIDLKVTPITTGGVPIYQTIWNGGTGSATYTRFGPTFQQIFMDLMASYYGSGTIPQFALQLDVRNRNGQVDSYQYSGMQFTRPRFGNFRATREVDMRFGINWATCTGTGALQAFLNAVAAV
ncbi:MAG TPA: hypothetical protein VL614_14895 [Acetobacteraceae bacterium]|jgi:hypothetical protein|nr:hypothetical protein [Acetobacteraceae bacterium]